MQEEQEASNKYNKVLFSSDGMSRDFIIILTLFSRLLSFSCLLEQDTKMKKISKSILIRSMKCKSAYIKPLHRLHHIRLHKMYSDLMFWICH